MIIWFVSVGSIGLIVLMPRVQAIKELSIYNIVLATVACLFLATLIHKLGQVFKSLGSARRWAAFYIIAIIQ